MGQGEIIQFLKENEGQIFTAKEIGMILDISSTSSSLLRLRNHPSEGFNFSKENLLLDKKMHDKAWSVRRKTYVYWYKKRDRD